MAAESSFPNTKLGVSWTTGFSEGQPSSKVLVSDKFDEVMAKADDAWSTADELIGVLGASVNLPEPELGLDALSATLPSPDDIPAYTVGDPPDTTLTLPVQPDGSGIAWQDEAVPLDDALVLKLATDLASGGTGLGAEVEQAIWDRADARLLEDQGREIDKVETAVAAKGWNMPTGVVNSMTMQISRDYARRRAELSSDIAIKQAELAQTNTHFVIEKSLAYVVEYRKYVIEKSLFLLKKYTAQVEAWKTVSLALISELEAEVKLYEAEVSAYATRVQSVKVAIEAKVAIVNAQIAQFKENVSMAVEREKLELEKAKEAASLQKASTQYGAQFASQMAASALGAVHASAQVGTDFSYRNSAGWNYRYGQSISEQVSNSEGYMKYENSNSGS